MVRDVLANLSNQLEELNRNLAQGGLGGSTVNKTVNNIDTSEPTPQNTSNYFSSGPERLAVENSSEWDRVGLGLVAATLSIRVTGGPIEVAFDNPNRNSQALTIRPEADSPFTIGGDPPIGTAYIWLRQADEATNTPKVEILAYQ